MSNPPYNEWRWKPGELVEMIESRSPINADSDWRPSVGIVLAYYDSNVYEAASVDILIDGKEIHRSTRELIRLKKEEIT